MGEVYLAEDTELDRKVAVKILPADVAADRSRMHRFRQEAKAASALNHPNIITIYEIGTSATVSEDSSISVETHFIATEFIDGETLRERLRKAPMKLGEVLDVATQISSALSAAHAAGIIHRDIKPENVMLRHDGIVKVLDFGLAKLTYRSGSDSEVPTAILVTDPGTVMGTVDYMSPEQALAQKLDHRTDIFSFGVMLYEMVTGERPFQGVSHPAIYAAILHHTPVPATQLHRDLPHEWQWIINRALEKDRELRFQTASDVKAALKTLKRDSGSGTVSAAHVTTGQPLLKPTRSRWFPKRVIASAVVIGLAITAYLLWSGLETRKAPSAMGIANFTQLTSAPGQEIYPSLSPDGKLLVYASAEAGNWDIYLQRVSGATPINLTRDSVADDTQPAFSPDGEQIVFRSDRDGGGIFVMGATGENVRRLADHGHNPTWSPDGQEIAYSKGSFARPSERGNYPSPLLVMKVATREARQVTETDAVQPNWSPHGDRIAYWGIQGGGQRDIWTVEARGGEPVAVTSDAALDWNPIWSPDGRYLYFASDRGGSMNLWRVPIDERSGKLLGAPEQITIPATYSGYFSFSRDGRHLAYAQAINQTNLQQVSFDPGKGRIEARSSWITQGSRVATNPDLSPDGTRIVFDAIGDKQEDLFIIRRDGTSLRQITNDKHKDRSPHWSPDGREIVFFSDRSGRYELWLINPDGGGLRQFSYTSGPGVQTPLWSPDGLRLLCSMQAGPPIIVDPRQPWAQQSPQPLTAAGGSTELMAWSWSADGRKLAVYSGGILSYSFDSRQYERLTDFGERPVWLNDNQRLLFFSQDKLYLLDSQTRRTQEIWSVAPNRFQSLGISRDSRVIYFSLQTTEADIWLASLEPGPK